MYNVPAKLCLAIILPTEPAMKSSGKVGSLNCRLAKKDTKAAVLQGSNLGPYFLYSTQTICETILGDSIPTLFVDDSNITTSGSSMGFIFNSIYFFSFTM